MAMTSAVPPEFKEFVEREIATGKFRSAEEVVSEGLRLLQERQRSEEALRAHVRVGLDQLDRGEGIELDDESLGAFLDEIESEVNREMAPKRAETQ